MLANTTALILMWDSMSNFAPRIMKVLGGMHLTFDMNSREILVHTTILILILVSCGRAKSISQNFSRSIKIL